MHLGNSLPTKDCCPLFPFKIFKMKNLILLIALSLSATATMQAQEIVRTYKIQHLISTTVMAKFKEVNPNVAVFDLPEGNQIVLKGEERDVDLAIQTISMLDVEQKMVGIEFMLVEYFHGTDFDWSLDLTQGQFGNFNSSRVTTGAINGLDFLYNAVTHLSPTFRLNLSALASENKAKVITNPHLVAQSGGDTSLKITENIQVRLAEVNNNSGVILQRLQEISAGVSLHINAVPTHADIIHLTIGGEVSAFLPFSTEDELKKAVTGLNSVVDLNNGETLIIGGIILEKNNKIDAGFPGLRKIPVLGFFFKRKKKVTEYVERVIYITPYTFYPSEITKENSLRQYELTRKPSELESAISESIESDPGFIKYDETKHAFGEKKKQRLRRRAERKAQRLLQNQNQTPRRGLN